MATTRTIGPLHFEDLDPKRFEDLVRQLIHRFKPWRRLEATGRSGADHGFDARGYEIVVREGQPSAPTEEGETVDEPLALNEGAGDRLWLIQCKRERAIGPKALVEYLDDTVLRPDEKLHGLLLTAACDFSKKARDDFAKKCREMGVEEWHLWGKAELEDRLFLPENAHLLFAYFGVSLTSHRPSQRADLRPRLALLTLTCFVITLAIFYFSIPTLWAAFHQAVSPSPTTANFPQTATLPPPPAQVDVDASKPAAPPAILVIQGDYTLCPKDSAKWTNPRWLDFLYDVDENAGKIAFFDVSVDVECLSDETAQESLFGRRADRDKEQVEYSFPFRSFSDPSTKSDTFFSVDKPRDPKRLLEIIPDNGAFVSVRNDNDGRNTHSSLRVFSEGVEDNIYGPFLIKKGGEDGFVTFELSPPVLDSSGQAVVSKIASQRKAFRLKQAEQQTP